MGWQMAAAQSAGLRPRASRGPGERPHPPQPLTWLLCSRTNGQCKEVELILEKTSEPKKYTTCESWSPHRAVLHLPRPRETGQ